MNDGFFAAADLLSKVAKLQQERIKQNQVDEEKQKSSMVDILMRAAQAGLVHPDDLSNVFSTVFKTMGAKGKKFKELESLFPFIIGPSQTENRNEPLRVNRPGFTVSAPAPAQTQSPGPVPNGEQPPPSQLPQMFDFAQSRLLPRLPGSPSGLPPIPGQPPDLVMPPTTDTYDVGAPPVMFGQGEVLSRGRTQPIFSPGSIRLLTPEQQGQLEAASKLPFLEAQEKLRMDRETAAQEARLQLEVQKGANALAKIRTAGGEQAMKMVRSRAIAIMESDPSIPEPVARSIAGREVHARLQAEDEAITARNEMLEAQTTRHKAATQEILAKTSQLDDSLKALQEEVASKIQLNKARMESLKKGKAAPRPDLSGQAAALNALTKPVLDQLDILNKQIANLEMEKAASTPQYTQFTLGSSYTKAARDHDVTYASILNPLLKTRDDLQAKYNALVKQMGLDQPSRSSAAPAAPREGQSSPTGGRGLGDQLIQGGIKPKP